jgi:hypothetical protein
MNVSCGECGAVLTPGKRFCNKCGHAVGSVAAEKELAPTKPVDRPPAKYAETELTEKAVEGPALVAAIPTAVAEPQVEQPQESKPEATPAAWWEQKEDAGATPQAAPAPQAAPPPPAAPVKPVPPVLGNKSPAAKSWIAKSRMPFVIAAAVLVLAGVGVAWYIHGHTKESAGTPQQGAEIQAANQPPPMASAPEHASKPSAGAPEVHIPAAAQAPSEPTPAARPASPAPVRSSNARESAHGNPAGPTPVFHSAPASSPTPMPVAPAQSRSGVRHYQGPPVPFGGLVVFDNLPKARLKFTFDGTAWRLILKLNPDGTKKVTLSSLKQGYQTSCDLGWEIAE